MSGLIRPKIERNRVVLPVLVISNFDDDSIKKKQQKKKKKKKKQLAWRLHFPIKSLWKFFLHAQGQLTP